jgi:hypothetical protein
MKTYLLIIVLSFGFFNPTSAQKTKNQIRVIADGRGDSIVLRWAPSTPFLWQLANKYGYTVERYLVKLDGKLIPNGNKNKVLLTTVPQLPATRAHFDLLGSQDDRAEIVKQAIYGDEFKLDDRTAGSTNRLAISQEMDNRFGFALLMCDLSPLAAKAAGLAFTDKDVKKGGRYIYRIRLAKTVPGLTYDPGVVLLDATESFTYSRVNDVTATFTDRSVVLKWPVFLHNGVYSAYTIERSEDGKTFKKISDEPLVNAGTNDNVQHAYFLDSLQDNTTKYFYRIRGISPFGQPGPWSDLVSGHGKEKIDVLTILEPAKVINNDRVRLTWRLDNPEKKNIKGFYVMRAKKEDGRYADLNTKMLGSTIFEFVDVAPAKTNYYRVRTILESDEVSVSYPNIALLIDSTPPDYPVGLSGIVDSAGIVRMKWKPNAEEDMYGYRVFRSNDLDEEFVEVTTGILMQPSFKDTITLKTTTSKVYYKVIALDKAFNASDYSPAFELKRPDIIPPIPPVFTTVKRDDTTVLLKWIPSKSRDVKNYVLTRINTKDNVKERISEWPANRPTSQFVDKEGLTFGQTYFYQLDVYDSASNQATVSSTEIFFEPGIRKAITDITAKADRDNRKIILTWNYEDAKLKKIIIYRAKQGAPLSIYETVPGNVRNFEDKELLVNNNYIYKIQAVFTGDIRSEISKEIAVKY